MSRMPWRDPEGGGQMSLRRLLALSGSLEILAGLLALISPAPVVSFQVEVPVVWDRSSPDAALRRGVFALGRHA
jgi:hypothetical protein